MVSSIKVLAVLQKETSVRHVSCVRPTPDGKYLCAVDNGIDQIKIYRPTERTSKLDLVDVLRCVRESDPRLIKFQPEWKVCLCKL